MQQKTGQQSSGLGKKGLCGSLSICTRTSEQEVSTSSLRGLWRKGKWFPLEGQQYHLPETGPRCSQPSGPGLFGAWSPQCGTSVPQQVLWDEHDSWSPQGVPAATFVQGVCQVQESRGTRSFRFRDLQACRAKKKKKKLSFQKLNPYVIVWFTVLTEKETKAQKDSTTWPAIQASLQASLWSSSGYFTPMSEDTCPSDPEFPARLM